MGCDFVDIGFDLIQSGERLLHWGDSYCYMVFDFVVIGFDLIPSGERLLHGGDSYFYLFLINIT